MGEAKDYWISFFREAGLPDQAEIYASRFVDNRMHSSVLCDLNESHFTKMGITAVGDILIIQRHIKLISKSDEVATSMSDGSADEESLRATLNALKEDMQKMKLQLQEAILSLSVLHLGEAACFIKDQRCDPPEEVKESTTSSRRVTKKGSASPRKTTKPSSSSKKEDSKRKLQEAEVETLIDSLSKRRHTIAHAASKEGDSSFVEEQYNSALTSISILEEEQKEDIVLKYVDKPTIELMKKCRKDF